VAAVAARLSERAAIGRRVRLFNQDTKVQALKRAPLFEGLSRKELVLLAGKRRPRGAGRRGAL
jgi:hypothetical protein